MIKIGLVEDDFACAERIRNFAERYQTETGEEVTLLVYQKPTRKSKFGGLPWNPYPEVIVREKAYEPRCFIGVHMLNVWRREEDSNLRTSHPRHTISNRAP